MSDHGHGAAMVKAGTEAIDAVGRGVRKTGDVGGLALAAAAEADVKARFTLARLNPRHEDDCAVRILTACRRPSFAAKPGPGKQVAMYSRPVGGRANAEGLSVHAAREFRRLWGNIDTNIQLVFEDEEKEVWRVATTDLEVNFRRSIDVQVPKAIERSSPRDGDEILKSRMNSYNKPVYLIRAEGDELKATRGKAIAIAERETILAMLPGDLKEEAIATVKATQANEHARDPAGARKEVCDMFADLGVMPREIEQAYLRHPLEQMTPAEYSELLGVATGIRSGDIENWAAAIAAKYPTGEETPAADKAREAVAAKREQVQKRVQAGKAAPVAQPTQSAPIDPEDFER